MQTEKYMFFSSFPEMFVNFYPLYETIKSFCFPFSCAKLSKENLDGANKSTLRMSGFGDSQGIPLMIAKVKGFSKLLILVLPIEKISLRPELSSPPRFRIQGGGCTLSMTQEEQQKQDRIPSF